ncbi:MAG: DUF1292 domain-containing protein [Clostridia bacterium]|nr:DUF1292 domain-containing protein [Clostridia bacterium]
MADIERDELVDEEEGYFMTLTDEETGEEHEFELYARVTIDDNDYYALVPTDEDGDEYVILRGHNVGDDTFFETIDDDEEFEKVEDYFNDLLFNEVNYDEN